MYLGNTPTLTIRTDFVFVATNGQTVFTGIDSNGLTLSYNTNNCDVFANGVLQQRIEYTTNSASTITLATPRQLGDVITVRSYGVPANVDSIMQGKFETANVGVLGAFRNKLINGNFDIWQRGTSQTASGYGSDDRWSNLHNGSTKTHSQQTFTLGHTDVPGNPEFFSRTVVTSVAGADNYVCMQQWIEDIRLLAGKTVTLTFYAKADANKNMAVEFVQRFGTGGTPSVDVNGIGSQLVALTTSWKRYDIVVNIPSIADKTIGTNGRSSSTRVIFWFDVGSNKTSRAANLGQQSGTFDIARVSLVEGDARLETDPFSERHIQQELALCQRYYEIGESVLNGYYPTTGWSYDQVVPFKVTKRAAPTIAVTVSDGVSTVSTATISKFSHALIGEGGNKYAYIEYRADAEL